MAVPREKTSHTGGSSKETQPSGFGTPQNPFSSGETDLNQKSSRAGGPIILRASEAAESEALLDAPNRPTHEEIELAAYEIYVQRGSREGSAVEDWLQAERELKEALELRSGVRLGRARAQGA